MLSKQKIILATIISLIMLSSCGTDQEQGNEDQNQLSKTVTANTELTPLDIPAIENALGMKGSEFNDSFINKDGKISTKTNYSGGIQAGISNGNDIYFQVVFKPVSTIMQKKMTVNTDGEEVEIEGRGRHDPCVLPRAVPIVDAMAALVMVDHLLRSRTTKL